MKYIRLHKEKRCGLDLSLFNECKIILNKIITYEKTKFLLGENNQF